MHDPWLELVDRVLRPARPHLDRCLREREQHLAARRVFAEERKVALADCEQRINDARAAFFAANDGVVTALMTDLEREWRRLSRRDPEAGLMDLWARIAGVSSIDRKRWRDSDPSLWLDAAIALAADAENVDVAEAAVGALRSALEPSSVALGSRIRWRLLERDAPCVTLLLARPLEMAREACPTRHRPLILERAQQLEETVRSAALARLPKRPHLARDFGHAAFVDFVWRAASPGDVKNPVTALRALWKTGYVLSDFDSTSVTLEIPPLA